MCHLSYNLQTTREHSIRSGEKFRYIIEFLKHTVILDYYCGNIPIHEYSYTYSRTID